MITLSLHSRQGDIQRCSALQKELTEAQRDLYAEQMKVMRLEQATSAAAASGAGGAPQARQVQAELEPLVLSLHLAVRREQESSQEQARALRRRTPLGAWVTWG